MKKHRAGRGRPRKAEQTQVNFRIPLDLRDWLDTYRRYRGIARRRRAKQKLKKEGRSRSRMRSTKVDWNSLFIKCIEYWWDAVGRKTTRRLQLKFDRQRSNSRT